MLVHNCKSCTFNVVRSVHNRDITFSAKRETVEDWENGKQLVKVLDQLDIFESCGKKAEIESLESPYKHKNRSRGEVQKPLSPHHTTRGYCN